MIGAVRCAEGWCEPVADWPEGGTLVFLLVIVIGGVWLYRRWR
jgi:hypothetical protein